MNVNKTLLEVSRLSYSISTKQIYEDVSFVLNEGQNAIIIGANGSGKTTFLNTLAGVIKPQSGLINIGGFANIEISLKELSTQMVYLPSHPMIPPLQKVNDYFSLIGDQKVTNSRFLTLTKERLIGKRISDLSSGEFKALAIARVLSLAKPIILLDEPTVTLDQTTISEFIDELLRMNKAGKSFIIATNNLKDFERLSYHLISL